MDSEGLSLMLIYFFGSRVGSCLLRPIAMRGRRITVAVCSFCRKSLQGKFRFGLAGGRDFAKNVLRTYLVRFVTCHIRGWWFFLYIPGLWEVYMFFWIQYLICDRRELNVLERSLYIHCVFLIGGVHICALMLCWFYSLSCALNLFVRMLGSSPLYK